MIKNDVKNISIKKAAFINAAANYSCVILQLGFSAILARILLPEDYGVIGVMTVFTTFFFGTCKYGDRHCCYSE